MADNDTPLEGPLSIDDVLNQMEAREEATPSEEQGETQETEVVEVEAEAEEVEEEADAETDEQEESETEEDGPEVYSADEYGEIAIALADGTQTTLTDLVKGNLRQADYTRKRQADAERSKELDAKEAALVEKERQLTAKLAAEDEQEPDWAKIAEEDPLGVSLKMIEWQKKKEAKAELRQKAQAEEQAQMQAFRKLTLGKALEAMPEWSDAAKFSEGADARKSAALAAGFTEQEYNGALDVRLAVLLEKAARYDAGQKKVAATTKKLSKVPKVIKPGTSVSKSDTAQVERAARAKRRNKPMDINEYLDTFDLK